MNNKTRGYLNALISGALFGFIPILTLPLIRGGRVSSPFTVLVRMLVPGLLLLPFTIRKLKLKMTSLPKLWELVIAAVLYSGTSILLYAAYNYIPSGIGITLHYMYPLVAMVISTVLFRQRFSMTAVGAMLAAFAGIVLLCDVSALPENAFFGILLAATSSVTFGSYLVFQEQRHFGIYDVLAVYDVMALLDSVILLAYTCATGQMTMGITAGEWAVLFAAAGFAIFANLMLLKAIHLVGSVYTSILGTLEPIVCTIGGALVLKEHISLRTVIGSALVLTAVVVVILNNVKRTPVSRHD